MNRFHKLIFYLVPALLGMLAFYLNEYNPISIRVRENIPYGPSPEEKFDYCQPRVTTKLTPAVILIHGGAWIIGDKNGNTPALCRNLAKNGIFVININYRLFSPKRKENYWPAQLQDAQLAVRWLRAHAASFRVDPARICAGGISSGGQMALFLGALKKSLPGDRASMYSDQPPDVQCVVADQAVTDLSDGIPSLNIISAMFIRPAPGEDQAQALRNASPINFITKDMAATLLVNGDKDSVVLRNQPEKLINALKKNNVLYDRIIYSGDHLYDGTSQLDYLNVMDRQLQFYIKNLNP